MGKTRAGASSSGGALTAEFLDMTAAERGAAKNTLDAYARDLADYTSFLARRGADPLGADTNAVRAFLADLDARGLKASSAARKLSCVRQFHRFLYAEGRRGDDPAAIIEGPRQGRPLPKVLSVAEVDRLLAVGAEGLDDEARPLAERVRAARMTCLLETLYATGLRVSELIALPRRAASARDPFITIRGKGGRERLTPLSDRADRLHARVPRPAGQAQPGAGRRALAVSFRQRERAHHASGVRARPQGAGGRGGHSRRRASARTCFATPSPATCCRTARTCASCRNFWDTPTSRRRRSTRTCSTSA